MGARCRENDPNVWGANAIFNIKDGKLSFASYYKMPAAQTESENCVAHNGSLIPIPGRDLKVQAWYQGGISVMDFTDGTKPFEVAYFDRGPIFEKTLILGGDWSAYWYNGYIYGSEIARGLDILELSPTKFLSQNEIDLARSIKVAELNVQDQKRIVYPKNLLEAKVYIDQLERSQAMTAKQAGELRKAIEKAESSKLSAKDAAKLKTMAAAAEKTPAKTDADSYRVKALSEILKAPKL